jgi:hypothetical protein
MNVAIGWRPTHAAPASWSRRSRPVSSPIKSHAPAVVTSIRSPDQSRIRKRRSKRSPPEAASYGATWYA